MPIPEELLPELRNFDHLPDAARVRSDVVKGLFGISNSTLWRWVKDEQLPKPEKFGRSDCFWRVGDIRKMLGQNAATQRQAA